MQPRTGLQFTCSSCLPCDLCREGALDKIQAAYQELLAMVARVQATWRMQLALRQYKATRRGLVVV